MIDTKGMKKVLLWKVFWLNNDEDDDILLFFIGRFTNRIKRIFYKMNRNTKWVPIPHSLVPKNLPLDDLTNSKRFSWLGGSPESIMAEIRKAES